MAVKNLCLSKIFEYSLTPIIGPDQFIIGPSTKERLFPKIEGVEYPRAIMN